MSVSNDSPISISLLRQGYKQLANNLGNLQMRVLKMVDKNLAGAVPADIPLLPEDEALLNKIATDFNSVYQKDIQLSTAIELAGKIMESSMAVNAYFANNTPWVLAKDSTQEVRFKQVIYTTLDALHLIATALYPLMPNSSKAILASLGVSLDTVQAEFKVKGLPMGQVKVPDPLFPFLPE